MRIAPLVPKKSHDWLTIAIIIAVVAFVVLIVTSKADAGQLVINSLPYTVNQSQHTAAVWDTVTLSANLSSATDGITLGTGTHHWYISMAGRILTFGTAAGNSAVGIRMNGNSNNIVVDGGSIVHAPAGRLASDDADPTYSASDPTNCIGILIGNYNIEVKNLSRCIVKGIATSGSVGAIFGGSYGINIHDNDSVINCYYGFQQRDLFMGCAVKTEAGISAIANGATYNVRLYRNNLISRAHTTVYFKGTSSLDPIRVEIDTNKVLIDCRNNMWTTSNGNDYHGCANGYGIQVTYAAAGSKIIGDTVRAGNKYLGGQGIQIVHSVATQASPLEIAYNYIDVHQGYELEFGTAFHPVAIKIRQQVFGLWLHHNTGTLWIDNTQAVNTHGIAYSATGHCLQLQTEFDLSERTFWGPFYITVENNNFSTKCVTDVNSSYYWADVVNFETCLFDDPTTVWRNNRLYSEVTAVYGIGQGGDGGSMYRRPYGDTISQKAMTFASKQVTFTLGNLVGTTDFNVFRDIVYGTGTSPTSHDWLHTGTATSTSRTMRNTVARTVPIKCINVGGIPLQNATVTVVNAYGTSFSLGTTGSSGTLSRVFNYAFYQNIGLDSLAFNPHTATVTWIDQNGQSTTVTQTFTVDQNTDTVRVYAPDLVEYRTVFNQGNNPSTYQVQLRGPKRQDIPLNKAREVVVFRGGTVTTTRNLTRYIDGVAADSIGVATAGDAYYEASFCVTDGDTIIWCVNNASVTGNGIRVRRIDASVKPMRLIDTRDILTGNLALYGAIAVPASLGGDDILIECRSSGNYSQAYQVEYLRSNDGGATWSTPASLSAWGGLSIRSAVEPWGLGTAWFTGIPASNSWLVRGATYNGTTWTRDDPNTTGMQIHREYAAAMTDDSTMVYLWADTAGVANIRYAYKKVGVGSWAYGSAYSTGMSGGWGSNPPKLLWSALDTQRFFVVTGPSNRRRGIGSTRICTAGNGTVRDSPDI